VQPGVLDATEEEAAVLRGLREDGAMVEMKEKGSRLVETNGAGVELSTNPAVNVVHGAVDVAGV
jgi:CTP-dependent riboflavin kinase